MTRLVPRDRQLALPGFRCTPTGLVANKTLSLPQWQDAGHQLAHIEGRLMWYIGDWLVSQRKKWEQGTLEEICEKYELVYGTSANASMVCGFFHEFSRRRENLKFGYHQEVTNRRDADELLDWCEETGASIKELRAEKRRRDKEAARIAQPDGKYRVIYADPPWSYGDERTGTDLYTGAEDHYRTMTVEELCELKIEDIAADNSVLFLWTTSPLNDEAFEVSESWGFDYKTQFVWDKVKHNVGHYVSVRHELLLICTRGSCTPDASTLPNSVQRIERGEHSEKPEEFYSIIEEMYTSGPYMELFARKKRKGWKTWGNQIALERPSKNM